MSDADPTESLMPRHSDGPTRQRAKNRSIRKLRLVFGLGIVLVLMGVAASWLGTRASTVHQELTAVNSLITPLSEEIAKNRPTEANAVLKKIQVHTSAAKVAADDPLFNLAGTLPLIGQNFSAVAEVARAADDVADLGIAPLVDVFGSLDWNALVPSRSGTDLGPLKQAAPKVNSAAYAIRESAQRLNRIETESLLPQIAQPLEQARTQLNGVTGTLDAAADASKVMPHLLGADAPRNYLLMIQNNAETRASGGIPGALAVLSVSEGKLALTTQSSASEVGATVPKIAVDPQQEQIYSGRLGKFMQDVNLTPDFPTAATTAQAMWEKKTGQKVDGVISIDPVALGYILASTGPIQLTSPELVGLAGTELPTELNGDNVVPTLLSDVYAKIEQPKYQDLYFAGVAHEIFSKLSDGSGNAQDLVNGLTLAAKEGRALVWSSYVEEQALIAKYPVSGSVSGPSVAPAQFGVYFNDGTGAKMDYYVKRTVQLVRQCPRDGYEETTVRITSTNTAPADAATSLPAYVTGDGNFGVPPGSVQTNIVAYGPVQANVESAMLDGRKTPFAPYLHSNRPVGVVAVQLAPGESRQVDFTFGKIVQHSEPNLVVTPTVQPVKDVTMPTKIASCS